MNDVTKCIAGLVFLICELKEHSISSEKFGECDVVNNAAGFLEANCTNRGLTSIPQVLPPDIKYLDISNNDIKSFEEKELEKYASLGRLQMMNLPVNSFPHNFFKYTPQLTVLNMSKTPINNLIELPPYLEVLNYSYNSFQHVDLSHLDHLTSLTMRYCFKMTKIPTLAESIHLEYLDLKYCPLTEANYTQIAKYCHLWYFGYDSEELRKEQNLHQCCGFKLWATTVNISSGFKLQGCNDTKSDNSSCDNINLVVDKNALDEYNVCHRKVIFKVFISVLLGIFISGILVAVVIALIYHFHEDHSARNLLQENTKSEEVESSSAETDDEFYEDYEGG